VKYALNAEWTKLRTLAGTAWLLLGTIALTIAVGALTANATTCQAAGCTDDTVKLSLTGIYLGQAIVAVLAVLAIGGEYTSGMIRTTLTAMPRRTTVLAAKAAVLTGLVLAAGVVAVLGSLVAGRLLLPEPALTDGSTLRAALGSVLYLVLVGLLSLGLATAVRDPAVGVGAVLGLLYLFPIMTQVVGDPHWKKHLEQIAPMTAGLAIQTTKNLRDLPIGPWKGLGVMAVWAVAALVLGGLLLRRRDA
jgi:ABC-2 type transport system permease protein